MILMMKMKAMIKKSWKKCTYQIKVHHKIKRIKVRENEWKL